jgi:metal-responsive CopG/Arc/MetJ family transcriptional regulator
MEDIMPDDEAKPKYVRMSITLREDVAEKLAEIVRITGLDRSGALSLAVQLFDLDRLRDKKEQN